MGEETIDEAMKIVSKHEYRNKKAVVYRNPEYDEYQVKFHHDNKHLKDADSFHSDKEDAQNTARHWIGSAKNEETLHESTPKSKEQYAAAIASAEKKAKVSKNPQNYVSYIQLLKAALRRLTGKKKISNKEVGLQPQTDQK